MATNSRIVTRSDDAVGYRTKADWAHLQLRRWIQSGALEPGERLDQEDLAARLGVSRVPLRQALAKLQADGLVIGRAHASVTVAPLSLEHAEDIYAGRAALETMLAAAAVPNLDNETNRELERLVEGQKLALENEDRQTMLELDRRFHIRIYEQSGYGTSVNMVDRLRDMSDRYVAAFQGSRERSMETLNQHEEIVAACEAGDADRAAELTKYHIDRGRQFLRRLLSGQ